MSHAHAPTPGTARPLAPLHAGPRTPPPRLHLSCRPSSPPCSAFASTPACPRLSLAAPSSVSGIMAGGGEGGGGPPREGELDLLLLPPWAATAGGCQGIPTPPAHPCAATVTATLPTPTPRPHPPPAADESRPRAVSGQNPTTSGAAGSATPSPAAGKHVQEKLAPGVRAGVTPARLKLEGAQAARRLLILRPGCSCSVCGCTPMPMPAPPLIDPSRPRPSMPALPHPLQLLAALVACRCGEWLAARAGGRLCLGVPTCAVLRCAYLCAALPSEEG